MAMGEGYSEKRFFFCGWELGVSARGWGLGSALGLLFKFPGKISSNQETSSCPLGKGDTGEMSRKRVEKFCGRGENRKS